MSFFIFKFPEHPDNSKTISIILPNE